MSVPWALQIGVAIFVMAWIVGIGGLVIHAFEWRSFKRGLSTAARHGMLLSMRLATTRRSTFERAGSVQGTLGGREVSHDTLLFPVDLPYASGQLNPCRLPWFGRAVSQSGGLRIEARIPLGLVMFASGWCVMAFTMTLMLFAVGEWLIALGAGVITVVAALGYRYTLARERQAADRFVRELERELTSAA